MGAFIFYTKDEIQETFEVRFTDKKGKTKRIRPLDNLSPNLEVALGIFKPILSAAMGNLGSNMHFYVFDDKAKSKGRLIDPYKAGKIDISLEKRNSEIMTTQLELPLDVLFIPRKCPNGKDAHISWKFCPWTGTPLN